VKKVFRQRRSPHGKRDLVITHAARNLSLPVSCARRETAKQFRYLRAEMASLRSLGHRAARTGADGFLA